MILFMPKYLIPRSLLPLIGYLLFFLLSFYHVLSSLERTKAPGTREFQSTSFWFKSRKRHLSVKEGAKAHSFGNINVPSSQTLFTRNGAT